ANIVIWPAQIERYRRAVVGAALLVVEGRVQRSPEGVVHVVAERLEDRSAALRRLDRPAVMARSPLPRSRDFH
ncbi:MAG: error-prone DNA polymerase, partial [Alphaproteobacteria bacterium]|nr:error-prone DNA polymerase [Alphaproteobacteria bacterium]